jgi:hypothetical protein
MPMKYTIGAMQLPYGPATKPEEGDALTTLDDCLRQAERLTHQLRQLARQKHPLDVRKGTSLKRGVQPSARNKVLKAGSKTYFFDIKRDKENRPYLVITESRFQGPGQQRERARLMLFSEHARAFVETIQTIAATIA